MRPAYSNVAGTRATVGGLQTVIDTDNYDDLSGTPVLKGAGKYGNVYLSIFLNGIEPTASYTLLMIYGRVGNYNSLALAEADLGADSDLVIMQGMNKGAIIGAISSERGVADLASAISGGTASITLADLEGNF